ncbi:MAG: prolyl oligopeptidase family serine peptidase, partial [Xanthomonadales bacterium]|nr:prolyl oligopeptidase family serine peptidase [Xanthomonadales bacterium]
MKFANIRHCSQSVSALLLLLLSTGLCAEPYPLEYWALRDVVSNVQVSPNGKRVALMKIPTRDGDPVIEVYDAANFEREPFRVNADPMEITDFDWLSDRAIVVSLRQKVRDKIEGFNQGVYETKLALLDVEKEEIEEVREVNPTIENLLPNEPNKVIISFNPTDVDRSVERIEEAFRPRAYYELNLERGTKKLLLQGKLTLGQVEFDGEGNPWLARGYDIAKEEFIWYIRRPGRSDWEEIHRQHEDKFETFEVLGRDENNPAIVFVLANNGRDTAGLWEFNVDSKSFGELVYARSDVNVAGVRMHSNPWTNPDTVVGVAYNTDKTHVEYFDAVEAATYAQLEGVIPEAHYLRVTSRSRDGQTLTVYNVGPRDPGTYYLLKDGRLQTVGSKQPLLKSEALADVRYISWTARDGKTIHGYLTVPHGEPPFPLIVLPHGGPFVAETVDYDEWGQLLANNGYLVLQPQYRGSTNYGLDFYLSAFIDGGQGGYRMQDDKDDGALHLVKEGLADADRMAMFGWSYGGYAALVAAARTPQIYQPQIYQCVIAGAAVSDPLMQVAYYSDLIEGAARIEQISMWEDSISPIKEVEKVNVPILLIHGDVDQRVPPAHVRKYLKDLEKYNKPHKYVELKGADHFSNT